MEIELNTRYQCLNFFLFVVTIFYRHFMCAFYMYRVLNLLIGNCAMHCTCISLDVCLSNNIKSRCC